jgi:hypothetical protein
MPDRPWKILLIGSNEGETARIKQVLLSGLGGEGIILAGTIDDARSNNACDEVPDVLFVDLDALGSAGISAVAALRRQAPAVPLIAIGRNGTESRQGRLPQSIPSPIGSACLGPGHATR